MNATHIENVVTKLRRTIGSGQEKAETSDLWEVSAKLTTIFDHDCYIYEQSFSI